MHIVRDHDHDHKHSQSKKKTSITWSMSISMSKSMSMSSCHQAFACQIRPLWSVARQFRVQKNKIYLQILLFNLSTNFKYRYMCVSVCARKCLLSVQQQKKSLNVYFHHIKHIHAPSSNITSTSISVTIYIFYQLRITISSTPTSTAMNLLYYYLLQNSLQPVWRSLLLVLLLALVLLLGRRRAHFD